MRKNKPISITLTPTLLKKLENISVEMGIKKTEIIRSAIVDFFGGKNGN